MIEHGHPLLEDDTGMTRFEPTPPRAFDEARIQNLIATRPELLPFEALHERDFGHARSIGTEITIANEEGTRGRIDVLLLNEIGRLTIVETKLFSNPQARREAAQIIEYAALLKKLDYEGLGLVHSSRRHRRSRRSGPTGHHRREAGSPSRMKVLP